MFVRRAAGWSGPAGHPAASPRCRSPAAHLPPLSCALATVCSEAMTAAADPEGFGDGKGPVSGDAGRSQQQRRMCITAAALAVTVLLAVVADRMSCRCGAALAARWLQLRRPWGLQHGAPNFVLCVLAALARREPTACTAHPGCLATLAISAPGRPPASGFRLTDLQHQPGTSLAASHWTAAPPSGLGRWRTGAPLSRRGQPTPTAAASP